jgi:hypothetical protein
MSIVRDISLILLAIEAFVLALVPLILFGGLAYGLWWLRRHERLPSWLKLAQAYLDLGRAYVELAMAAVVRPVFMIHSALSTIQGWFRALEKRSGGS